MDQTLQRIAFAVDPMAGAVMIRVLDLRTGRAVIFQEMTPAEARAFGDGVFRAAGEARAMEAMAGA